MDANEYIAQRLDDQIAWYALKSLSNQYWYKGLRMAQFVAAALIPFLAAYSVPEVPTTKLVVGLFGVVIAVITATLDLCRFQEHWIEYRTTCEALKKEKYLHLAGSAPYISDPVANFRLLVQRAEALISKENSNWAHYVLQPSLGPDKEKSGG